MTGLEIYINCDHPQCSSAQQVHDDALPDGWTQHASKTFCPLHGPSVEHRDSPLSVANVDRVFTECLEGVELHADGSLPDTAVVVEGILHSVIFSRATLAKHQRIIGAMLDQLPTEFKPRDQGGGDGWSFLNACMDRDDNQWTGEHLTMEKLFMLGFGTGQAKWVLPRELWTILPGGMPYVMVEPFKN